MVVGLEHFVHAVEQVRVLAQHVAREVCFDICKAIDFILAKKVLLLFLFSLAVLSDFWFGQASHEQVHYFELRERELELNQGRLNCAT